MSQARRPDPATPEPADEPVLPEITDDERAVGWGDDYGEGSAERRDAEWYRRERPPHHE